MQYHSKIFILFFITIFCSHLNTLAQKSNLDSLAKVQKTLKEDTTKVNFLLVFAEQVWQTNDYNRAIQLCQEGLTLAKKLKFQKGIGAIQHRLGTLYIDKGEYEKALANLLDAVRIWEKTNDRLNQARSLANIGALYQDRKDYSQALIYSEKSLQIFEKLNDTYAISLLKGNIGHLYTLKGQFEKGLTYLNEAVQLKEKMGDMQGLAYVLNYIGHNYLQQKEYPKTLEYYLKALSIEEQGNATYLMGSSYKNIGATYFVMQKFDDAQKYFDKAMEISTKIGAKKELVELYADYAQLDSARANYTSALAWYKKYKILSDSLSSVETNKQIAFLQTTFEVEKKEAQIKSLSQENQIQSLYLIALGLLLLGLFIGGFAFYNNRRLVAKYAFLEVEQRWRRAQMNPHFFFNALAAIQKFVMQADKLQATSYIAKFSKLMRRVLEQSQDEFISLEDEIETITHYIDLQLLRLGNKFEYQIEIDKNLSIADIEIPSMLTQPVIENAIEHGLISSEVKGLLKINFKQENSYLCVEVDDNGVGLKEKNTLSDKHRSFATSIIEERIKLLKAQKGLHIKLNVIEKPNKSGLKVVFLIPIKNL